MDQDIRLLNRRAVERSVQIVAAVRDDQWELPTPCSEWTLDLLLRHMTAHHRGFAAAARGETEDTSPWEEVPLGDDPRAAYASAAGDVVDAFAADGVPESQFWLPEITPARTFPAPLAIGFHFLDYVVHGWDVAAAIGVPAGFDDDLLDEVLVIAHRDVPVGPSRERPGASFRPPVEVAPDAPRLDRALAVLGRSPDWPK